MKIKKFENFEFDIKQIYDEFKILNKPIKEEFLAYSPGTYNVSNYKNSIKNHLHNMMSNLKGISEKDFKRSKELTKTIDWIFNINPEIDEVVRRYAGRECRHQLAAEHIYEWFIKDSDAEKIMKMDEDD